MRNTSTRCNRVVNDPSHEDIGRNFAVVKRSKFQARGRQYTAISTPNSTMDERFTADSPDGRVSRDVHLSLYDARFRSYGSLKFIYRGERADTYGCRCTSNTTKEPSGWFYRRGLLKYRADWARLCLKDDFSMREEFVGPVQMSPDEVVSKFSPFPVQVLTRIYIYIHISRILSFFHQTDVCTIAG
ncbi:uncharacterized protein LOC116848270 [Odontomachus brunneus]|uniref:uncharacterized protein LOC116848270 n=1 Tax=Odontomachus brunneus TaxID=486640 RepID=UPI0013F1CD72|nr:uncharacterized protein LOC116848270 [Odontomachus brunneus]